MLHHVHEYTATDNGFSWFLNKQQSSAAMQGEDAGGGVLHKEDSREWRFQPLPTPCKSKRLQLAEARFRDKYKSP